MTDPATHDALSDPPNSGSLTDLAPGFDANKAPHSIDLAGRSITVRADDGTRASYEFAAHELRWDGPSGSDDRFPATGGTDRYEAFAVDPGLYFVQFHPGTRPDEAVSLILDLSGGRALTIRQHVERDGERTTVGQRFVPARIDGVPTTGAAAAPTTALIGRRALWVYSPRHAYEHVYLNPDWYTWHCLAGPEQGLADTDRNTTWAVRPGVYLFAWQEKAVPCAAVTIADHRTGPALRSHGVLFGLDGSGTGRTHFTFGAHGRLLSTTAYPEPYDATGQDSTVTPA